MLGATDRATVVAAVQDHTLAGVRLTPDDILDAWLAWSSLPNAAGPGQVLESLPTSLQRPVPRHRRRGHGLGRGRVCRVGAAGANRSMTRSLPPDRGWDSIDDHQVYRFTHHSQEVIGGSQAVFRRRARLTRATPRRAGRLRSTGSSRPRGAALPVG